MVDTLVSGASASRHVGSSPILGTIISAKCTKNRFYNAVEAVLFCLNPKIGHICSIFLPQILPQISVSVIFAENY